MGTSDLRTNLLTSFLSVISVPFIWILVDVEYFSKVVSGLREDWLSFTSKYSCLDTFVGFPERGFHDHNIVPLPA